VKPLTKRRESADEDKRSPFPSPRSPQHFQPQSVVVVLGVMYPSLLPQPREASAERDPVSLLPGVVAGRQSVDVVFYDPLSSGGCEELPQGAECRRNSTVDGHVDREEARKALARDLALLSLGKRT
jgi:hypothetical protein